MFRFIYFHARKLYYARLACLVGLILFPMLAFAAYDYEVNGVYYRIINTGAAVTSGTRNYSGDVDIPASVYCGGRNYSVTEIDERAFAGNSLLTSISLPSTIQSIGLDAFLDCNNLSTVNISNLDSWFNISFKNGYSNPVVYSHNLILNGDKLDNIVIPTTSVLPYTLAGLKISSLTIPSYVTDIKSGAFFKWSCKEIAIEDSSTPLTVGVYNTEADNDNGIFYNSEVETVYLGRNLCSPDKAYGAFHDNSKLTNVTISDSVTELSILLFAGCSSLTSITIPNSVTSIGEGAFWDCSSLTSVTIPNSVTSISGYTFYRCGNLTSVSIPESVTSIGVGAFNGCGGLTSIEIPNSVVYIGGSAFQGCGLTSVTIPKYVTTIGPSAFKPCDNLEKLYFNAEKCEKFGDLFASTFPSTLKEVYFGKEVKIIPTDALRFCSEITTITIPNSVTSIGEGAFYGCTSIKEVNIEDGEETLSVELNIRNTGLFYDCPLEKLYLGRNLEYEVSSHTGLSPFYEKKDLTELTIGPLVTNISRYEFSGCNGLTSVSIPNSVTTIDESAFRDCIGLYSISIGIPMTSSEKSEMSIGESAFSGCSSLSSVSLGNSVTTINYNVFENCSSLTSITIPNSVTKISCETFNGCISLKELYFEDSDETLELGSNNRFRYYDLTYKDGFFMTAPSKKFI